ncbi:Poly(A)+ RNA export protein rae1 [Prototheca wickerhamii]|uniref:Poly(A)+ RNA export protein rae1 n=1 Tax=Prototheca wickerhamii TaxID=3111 RepID=A0AAD9IM37_PROWI|nr:Poly(A)+ RNA export protein rae1 [Prototheca wickerhamii]
MTDGVSSLSFSPVANHVVATSWSGQVLCWEIQLSPTIQQGSPSVASIPKAAIQLDKPVLCSAWQPDGSTVFIGGCDNTAKMWNLATNQQQQVAAHSEPVRHCLWVPQHNMLVTGSWDKTLKYWDLRSPNPVHTHQLPERCYGLSSSGNIMVAATAERHIQIFNLANPQTPWKTEMSPLKFQTRCVACFPDAKGYLLGSVEGRVAVQYVDDPPPPAKGDSFTFKCHRSTTDIYAVNGISFHPRFGTFATCGSDGGYTFWDKDSKQRLKGFTCGSVPISLRRL